jgi:hypothetical protein
MSSKYSSSFEPGDCVLFALDWFGKQTFSCYQILYQNDDLTYACMHFFSHEKMHRFVAGVSISNLNYQKTKDFIYTRV